MGTTEEVENVGRKLETVEEGKEAMTPWEQHASVINIPRFDYAAPCSLLHRTHSGFLITCTIKREKSATKEVMSILGKYVGSINEKSQVLITSDVNGTSKRRKLFVEEIDGKSETRTDAKDSSGESGENSKTGDLKYLKENIDAESNFVMSLVKLTRSGLLLLTFPTEHSPCTTKVVSTIFQSLESRAIKLPLWCHRIFPVQATCGLTEKELQETVSKLVRGFLNDKDNKLSHPLKFAAGYNRRGMEETQGKTSKEASEGLELCPLLDRGKCFEVVAAGVKAVEPDSSVDLKSPELCVLVELLPLSGIPNGSFVAAVSVLPQNLISTKPRLCIKPLVSDAKQRKGKS